MASARYTRNIKPEDILPDEQRILTKKEKLENFWYYHKWHLILGTSAIITFIAIIVSIITTVTPDFEVAIITSKPFPTETMEELEKEFSALCDDTNGDGENLCYVTQYYIPADGEQAVEGGESSNIMQLQANVQGGASVIFLVDNLPAVQKRFEIFTFINDPYANTTSDDDLIKYEKMSKPLTEFSKLNAIHLDDVTLLDGTVENVDKDFKNLNVALRMFTGSTLEENKKFIKTFENNMKFFKSLK